MKYLKIFLLVAVLIAVVMIGIVFYQNCSGSSLVQRIDKTEPDIIVAPYQVSTKTHTYYAAQAEANSDGSATMTTWYYRMDNKWIKVEGSQTITAVLRPIISRRS